MKRHLVVCVLFCFLAVSVPLFSQQAGVSAEVQAGVAALRQGDLASAEQHFETALKTDPGLAEVRANLALAFYADHRYQQAISQFREALKQNPSLQTAKFFLPLSLAAIGDCSEAMPGLIQEFDSSANPRLQRVLGLSLLKCRMQSGDNVGASETAAKLLASYPDDPDVLYTAGQLYTRLSNLVYLRLMKVAPNSARTRQLTASVAAADGNWRGAISAYRQALQIDPNLEGAHLQIAILILTHSQQPGAWTQALAELKDELRIDPTNAEAYYEIGEVYRKHNQLNQAVAALDRSLQFDPAAVPTRISLAKALRSMGKKREALASLEPAQKTAPDDPDIHFLLAQLYRELGRNAEAHAQIELFQRLQKAAGAKSANPGR
ncbi:MAG TPA: tetratricopeptide repeat protein [Terriglobia bacterium]|nr:tetratricopeptide repeat protein [Terriglobia bacterium]